YFVSDENSASSQPAQAKLPLRCSSSSGLVKGRSVAACLSTANWSGVSSLRHSASVWVTSKFPCEAPALPPRRKGPDLATSQTPPTKRQGRLVTLANVSREFAANHPG